MSGNTAQPSLHCVNGDEVREKPNKKVKVRHEQDSKKTYGRSSRRSHALRNSIRRPARTRKRTSPETGAQASPPRASAQTPRPPSSWRSPPRQGLGDARRGSRRRSCRSLPVTPEYATRHTKFRPENRHASTANTRAIKKYRPDFTFVCNLLRSCVYPLWRKSHEYQFRCIFTRKQACFCKF